MEIIFELLYEAVLLVFLPFKKVKEETIETNLNYLKEQRWFTYYYESDQYRKLIDEHEKVRKYIGQFNVRKMSKSNYYARHQARIERIINKYV